MHLMIDSHFGGGAGIRSGAVARNVAWTGSAIRNHAANTIIWDEERHHVQARFDVDESFAPPGEIGQ
jgi:hypothetical protein